MSTSAPGAAIWTIGFDGPARVKAALVGLAFVAVFQTVLLDLWYSWTHSQDWSHGPIIPLFSVYLIYMNWERIRAAPIRSTWVGLVVLGLGLGAFQWALWIRPTTYVQQGGMLVALLGVIILLCGLPVMRIAWVPWLYLFFAIPLPKAVYYALTDPLRRMAASVATGVLAVVPTLQIERVGSVIEYTYQGVSGTLGVVDACSGMRSTITLCALGVAVAFLSERPVWQRVVMVVSCVPIAVFSNFIRVTTTCILYIFVDPKYAEGTTHTLLGLVTLLIAFAMFSGLGWILNHLVIADEAESAPPGGSQGGAA